MAVVVMPTGAVGEGEVPAVPVAEPVAPLLLAQRTAAVRPMAAAAQVLPLVMAPVEDRQVQAVAEAARVPVEAGHRVVPHLEQSVAAVTVAEAVVEGSQEDGAQLAVMRLEHLERQLRRLPIFFPPTELRMLSSTSGSFPHEVEG
jgi:hypothetical protein